jgi:glyoxylase-like metal-dependent hydrolase (beta-lactamase superfamily II)
VLPTHLHFDHVMGIDPLARAFGVPVALGEVAHAAAAAGRRLRYPHWIRLCRAIGTWPLQGLPFPPWADWRAPFDVGFPWGRNAFRAEVAAPLHDGDDLPGCPGWRILHTPGHADDAVCLHHADAGFLIAGDTVRNFYGGEWNPLLCDREAYRRTQARLRSLRVDAVMPGHGPVVDGPDVVARLWTPPPFLP